MSFLQLFLTFLVIVFLFFINKKKFFSTLTIAIINTAFFLESVTLVLFFPKFDILLSILLLMVSSFFLFENLHIQNLGIKRTKKEEYFIVRESNLVKKIGFVTIVSYIFIEILFLDKEIGRNGVWILILGFLWYFNYKFLDDYIAEYNFLFYFFNLLFALVILPSIMYTLNLEIFDSEKAFFISSPEMVDIFLARPLVLCLDLIGIWSINEVDYIHFEDNINGVVQKVQIGEACSGIHSVSIFISAFIAYNLSFRKYISLDTNIFLLIGIIFAYLANLIRMVIIIVIGHYRGIDDMLWVHANIGFVVFIIWVSIFFYLESKFLNLRIEDRNE